MNKKPNVLSRLLNFNTLAITLSLVATMPVQAFVSYNGHLNDDSQDRNSVNLGVVMYF